MIPLTGAQHEIAAGEYQATITELGAGLRELRHRGRPLVAGYEPNELPPGAAGQVLVPWPNRVDGGRYTIGNASYQLDLSEPGRGNAIHGLTRWASWPAVRNGPGEVSLRIVLLGRPGYPFCLEFEVEYQLSGAAGLQANITARNVGPAPAPYGAGSHPYLTTGAAVDDGVLSLPASRWLPADDRGIPVGPVRDVAGTELDFRAPRPVGRVRLDHTFTGLDRAGDGRVWVRLASGGIQVTLWAGPGYQWLQVFTGDTLDERARRRALAVEPMTCPPNAFVSGTDLIMLDPGDAITHSWGIAAG